MPVLHVHAIEMLSVGSHYHCHITPQVNINSCCGCSLQLEHPLDYGCTSEIQS